MSDTPRTNDQSQRVEHGICYAKGTYVPAWFGKQLERELTTLRQQLADMTARAEEAERKLVKPDVEKVARAICRVCVKEEISQYGSPWQSEDEQVNNRWTGFIPDAKAAIKALEDTK